LPSIQILPSRSSIEGVAVLIVVSFVARFAKASFYEAYAVFLKH